MTSFLAVTVNGLPDAAFHALRRPVAEPQHYACTSTGRGSCITVLTQA